MHNIKFIRKNSELFIKKIKTRNVDLDYKIISDLDEKNRKLITDKENLERDKKEISKKKIRLCFKNQKKFQLKLKI